MSHHHHHHHHHGTENIATAFFLNLLFTTIELIGGIMTNSLAILSDALHDLGDSLSLGLAWYFQKLSGKSRDKRFTYGYRRFSILGALINSIILVVGSIFIIKEAIPRIIDPQVTNSRGMMILAVLGVIVNGAAVWKLKKGTSHNERVVSLHLLEDVLGWVAVLVGSIIIYFTGWYQIDPILSVLIGLFILFNVYRNIKSTLNIILQGIPDNVELKAIEGELKKFPGILAFHDLHVWSLDGEKNMMTIHVVMEDDTSHEATERMKQDLKHTLSHQNINHCTIEVEYGEDTCGQDCIFIDADHHH